MNPAAIHLRAIVTLWPLLDEALSTSAPSSWPPAGRMSDYLKQLDELDMPQRGARDGSGTGEAPAPLRIHVLDTQRLVHAALLGCADAIAEHVQRQPMAMPAPRRAAVAHTRDERVAWADHARRVQAAQDDAADRRRWRWTGARPSAPYAALWLLARVLDRPGPFTPLAEAQRRHVANVASGAIERIDHALQLARITRPLGETCACGGRLAIDGGDGEPPTVRCTGCHRRVTAAGGLLATSA